MIRWYWEQVGGLLCEEFRAVPRTSATGQRLLDAVILPNGPKCRVHWRDLSLRDQVVIVVQAKAKRLGMYLMGQTLFSVELIKRFEPRLVHSVALCKTDDSVLRPMLESYPNMKVIVVPEKVWNQQPINY